MIARLQLSNKKETFENFGKQHGASDNTMVCKVAEGKASTLKDASMVFLTGHDLSDKVDRIKFHNRSLALG